MLNIKELLLSQSRNIFVVDTDNILVSIIREASILIISISIVCSDNNNKVITSKK